ncbi:hypothetical protein BH11GEM1_BH11GEM1_14100 [soil metagenome]
MTTQLQPLSLHALTAVALAAVAITAVACAGTPAASPPSPSTAALAQVYFWRARPAKLEEYTRYIRDVAEPIDHAAQRSGAFLSVTTYMANDSTVPWTHMRVFLLRDSTQLRGLSNALTIAGALAQPDSVKRRQQGEYSATLRDRIGSTVVQVVR